MIDITEMFLSGTTIEKKEALIEINEETLGSEMKLIAKGENNLITGKPGCGKSLITAHLISQFLFNPSEWFLISEEEIAVVLFDTEQSEGQIVDWYVRNVYNEMKDEIIKSFESINNYKIYSIKDDCNKLESFEKCLDECKNIFKGKHLLIIIDNLTSFVRNIMESNNEYLETINRCRETNTLITILHESNKTNANSDPTGHIGSQSERNAAIHWHIEKKKDNIFTMECKKSRFQDVHEMQKLQFTLSEKNEILYFSDCEFTDQTKKVKKPSRKIEVLNAIKIILEPLEWKDNGRLRKNIISKLINEGIGIKKAMLYRYIDDLIKEKLLTENKEKLIHENLPF
jgi:KaiC/GvpD/RAD55 family RecA-like ATPase